MNKEINGVKIELEKGDITRQEVDAIVNAANMSLLGGGGVDGAIHKAGGPAIREACKKLNGCKTGDAKITTAGNLPALHVIHTVGPVYNGGKYNEAEELASCYRRSLEVAKQNGVKTIAFPSISTGAYGYPVDQAAKIALDTVSVFLKDDPVFEVVRFVLFDDNTLDTYKNAFEDI